MEQKYSVRIETVSHKEGERHVTNACVWIGEAWADETLLFNAIESGQSKAESVIACLDALEPRLDARWRLSHYDSSGQFYMFGEKPQSIDR